MTELIEIKLIHGWGFDANFWRHWQFPALDSDSIKVEALDRGYMGRCQSVTDFDRSAQFKVLIAHSFGLHLTPPTLLANCDLLVLISSFLSIHPKGSQAQQSRRMVEHMEGKLVTKTKEILNDFYIRCGTTVSDFDGSDFDVPLLMVDLQRLNNASFNPQLLTQIPEVLILHGTADRIVPISKSLEMNELLPNSSLYLCDGAQHALPCVQFDWCQYIVEKHIRNGVNSFVEVLN